MALQAGETAAATKEVKEPPPRIEPFIEPVNGIVQPPVVPPPDRPGRLTNQLAFIQKNVIKAVCAHKYAWPLLEPVDAKKLNLPVSIYKITLFDKADSSYDLVIFLKCKFLILNNLRGKETIFLSAKILF